MASNETYISDKELAELYNSLEKGSLVRMLIEKHRQLEKQAKNLTIPVVDSSFICPICKSDQTHKNAAGKNLKCLKCDYEEWAKMTVNE